MEQKKKIAFVSNTLWSIFHFRFQLIRRLLQQGFEVFVLAPADDTTVHFEGIQDLRFIPLNNLARGFVSPFHEWRLYRELRKQYRALKPDLIFHYTIKPNIIGSRAAAAEQVRAIAVVTGLGYTLTNRPILGGLVRPMYRNALRKTTRVWFLNEGDQLFFKKHRLAKPEQVFVLPGEGVDTSRFSPIPTKPNHSGSTHFLMVARLLKNKGVPDYIEAAAKISAKLPEVRFTLIGTYDPEAPDVIPGQLYQRLLSQDKIRYLSFQEDIRPEMAKADVFVLPSVAEGLSMSIMEAASMEKPVIVSDVPGCRELVTPGISGLLSTPGNTADLAEKMYTFIKMNPEQKKIMGIQGRKLMLEKFALDIVIDIYLENIRQLLGETNGK